MRIYPHCKSLYFKVYVFRTWNAMHQHCVMKTYHGRGEINRGRSLAQCFNGPQYDDEGKLTPCLGEIIFYKNRISPDIVSHEMTHGAIYWASRANINPVDDTDESMINGVSQEELFVMAQQEMVKQFFEKIAKFDLDKKQED